MNRRIKIYFFYILLGLLYPVVKLICYINGLVYLRGVVYGLIAGVSTISVGILALKEYDGADKPVWHWLAALVPLIIIPFTPIIMILHFLFATAEHLDPNEFMKFFANGNLFTLIEQRGEVFRLKRD